MASTASITGKTGAGIAVTSLGLTIIKMEYDFLRQVLRVTEVNGTVHEFDQSANTTTTLTFSNGNYTLTCS